MKNELTVRKQELSTTTVDDILPQNFEKLPVKKQNSLILNIAKDQLLEAIKVDVSIKETIERAKVLQMKINSSQQMRDLKQLKRDIKQHKTMHENLVMQFQGMLKLAGKLGFNLESELKKFRVIEE